MARDDADDDDRPHPNGDPLSRHGIHEDGIFWEGSRESLEAWKAYKRTKAHAFVERGYSVSWYPDGHGWMSVYLPERHHAGTPEIRAEAKFYSEPSQFGIEGGKISKLSILTTKTDVLLDVLSLGKQGTRTETLYNYDRGLEVDHLHTNPQARALYDAILEELN